VNKRLGPRPTRGLAREELSPARRAALDALIDLGGRRTVSELAVELDQHANTVREHLEALVRVGLAERSLRHSTGRGRPAALYRATLAATPAGPEYAVLAEVLITYLARAVPDRALRVAHARAAGREWGRAIRERHLVDAPRAERRAALTPHPAPPHEPPTESALVADSALVAESAVVADSALVAESAVVADSALVAAPAPEDPAALRDSVTRLGEMFDRAGFDCRTSGDPDGGYTQRLRRCPVLELAREHPDVVCTSHLGMAQEILEHEGISADRVSLTAFAEPGACLLRIAPPAEDPAAPAAGDE